MLNGKETVIDDMKVETTPWPFLTLIERKRILVSILSKNAPDLLGALSSLDTDSKSVEEAEEVEMIAIVEAVAKLMSLLDTQALGTFIKWIMFNTTIDNIQMNDQDELDIKLAGKTGSFYKIAAFVLKVNYGDFLELAKSLMGKVPNGIKEKIPTV